jgi:folate-binding Fe-S cluster repair protein YgfZ
MGQELTARTHYRGLIKKHLYVVEADSSHDSLADSGTEIKIDGRIVGEMRSSCSRIGLAILKDEAVEDINASSLMRVLKS